MKSIYILDDHPIITEGIAQLLANNQQYQITTGHHDSELYNYLNDHTPDLLIIDYEILPLVKEYWFDDRDKVEEWEIKLHNILEI